MDSPESVVAIPDDASPSSSASVLTAGRSLTKSVLDYEYLNGRRYHSFRAGQYLLPNDEQEQKRMDLLHHIWRMLLGGELLRTELDMPQRVLDVGTGTGLWAIDCADQFPSAQVVATDLSPIQPELVPENLQFFIDDAESDWDWEPFDLIHGRCLGGSIQDWPRFYQQCFDHMMPGGRIEMQEHDSIIKSADTTVPPWTAVWMTTLTKAFDARGQTLNAADKHAQWMEEAGFIDIEDRVHQVPIGSWAKDKSLKELGRWHLVQMVDAVEPYTLAMYTDVLGRDLEETQVAIEMVRKELRERKHHLYVRYHFITAKKPD